VDRGRGRPHAEAGRSRRRTKMAGSEGAIYERRLEWIKVVWAAGGLAVVELVCLRGEEAKVEWAVWG